MVCELLQDAFTGLSQYREYGSLVGVPVACRLLRECAFSSICLEGNEGGGGALGHCFQSRETGSRSLNGGASG